MQRADAIQQTINVEMVTPTVQRVIVLKSQSVYHRLLVVHEQNAEANQMDVVAGSLVVPATDMIFAIHIHTNANSRIFVSWLRYVEMV